jgi:hypothetical protein
MRFPPRVVAVVGVVSVFVGVGTGFAGYIAGTIRDFGIAAACIGGMGATFSAAHAATTVICIRRDRENSSGRPGRKTVQRMGRMLPATVRSTYVEEWQAWLLDLREQDERWYRRLAEWLSIVFVAAPYLVVMLRLGRRKAVE